MKLFFFKSPASVRSAILLEALELDYKLIFINLREKDQLLPAYKKLNPLHTAPTLLDDKQKITLAESGAIGMHLAFHYNKDGKFLGSNSTQQASVLQWYFWAVSNLERNMLNLYNIANASEAHKTMQITRLDDTLDILNTQLENKKFITEEFSIADMFIYPALKVIVSLLKENKLITKEFKNINTYLANLQTLPCVIKATAKIDALDLTQKLTNDELEKIIASA
jgi:glutathione S-transferase